MLIEEPNPNTICSLGASNIFQVNFIKDTIILIKNIKENCSFPEAIGSALEREA